MNLPPLFPLLLLLCAMWPMLLAAQPISPKDWPQYNYDNRGWRYNHAEIALSPANVGKLIEKWRFPPRETKETIGVVHATPVVVNGFVYFGTATQPAFYKLSPRGNLVWKYAIKTVMTKENGDPYAVHGFPLEDNVVNAALVTTDYVCFGTFGGQIICLDRLTGAEVWKINTKQAPFPGYHPSNTVMSSPILADGKIIVAGGGFEHFLATVPEYPCCSGRGYVAALEPETGEILWKYDVGPPPEKFDPPLEFDDGAGRKVKFVAGPSTSSIWSTPSYDDQTKTLFFGTDTHNAPRKPTPDDARLYNQYSSAVIAISVSHGAEKWVRQLSRGDVWNGALPTWDPQTGDYKDVTVGDTPKIYTATIAGKERAIVGVGCKNGAFYVIDRGTGEIVAETTAYRGPPVAEKTADADSRVLAMPSSIGGLQTGCACDGQRVYTNGIDWLGLVESKVRHTAIHPPAGGRVTAIAPTALAERWRHERPKVEAPRGDDPSLTILSGDPVGSGIAVANGVVLFTTTVSGKLIALKSDTGQVLKEIELGPVWCGPSVSRGRVYVGTGNTLFQGWAREGAEKSRFVFPAAKTGALVCLGLPGEDEVDRLSEREDK